jgi:hypothetical protein
LAGPAGNHALEQRRLGHFAAGTAFLTLAADVEHLLRRKVLGTKDNRELVATEGCVGEHVGHHVREHHTARAWLCVDTTLHDSAGEEPAIQPYDTY